MEAMTYEEAIKRLEEIVSLLENNEIALEEIGEISSIE